ncbi:HVO_0476 family zinc finger protein [uncultured Methanobrevibacter sp.]|uniref:HVO_0476 family zinc finger protein n=1 Tax=uncultured Methanobrevibacter sp. TaxID=253161 RepID=UPI0025D38A56|nr:HVO_0476 family zinc finger protein [uncultured Methanobrevibacter sp.]MEE1134322.1 HVO_0476 family zinc finger protein [Methanobrevibacter sp.]
MDCPICGSDEIEILNSKQKTSKKKFTEEYLLKCEDCGHVFKDVVSLKKPRPYRIIISEQDKSHKTTIDLSPSDELEIGDVLLSEFGQVEVSGIEVGDKRVKKSQLEDVNTIWASSIEIPARIGFSVDLHGEVDSYKLDLERDFEIAPGDVVKIDNHIVKVHVIKTQERKLTSGFAKANVIKRVYSKPVKFNNYDYDLTKNIFKKSERD